MLAREYQRYATWHSAEGLIEGDDPDGSMIPTVIRQLISVGPAAYVIEWWAGGFAGHQHPLGTLRKVALWPNLAAAQERFALTEAQVERLWKRMHPHMPNVY